MNKTIQAAVDLSKTTMGLGYDAGVYAERQRCLKLVETFTDSYLRSWTKIVGEDRAKATAWDIAQLRKQIESSDSADSANVP